MSLLPNPGGQSSPGASLATLSPFCSAIRQASMAGQSTALRASFQTPAP